MPSGPDAASAAGPAALAQAMPATATAPERALSSRRHSRGASLSQQALTNALAAAAPMAPHSRHGSLGAGLAAGAEGQAGNSKAQQAEQGGGAGEGDDLEAELAKHNRTLEEEYMAMVGGWWGGLTRRETWALACIWCIGVEMLFLRRECVPSNKVPSAGPCALLHLICTAKRECGWQSIDVFKGLSFRNCSSVL